MRYDRFDEEEEEGSQDEHEEALHNGPPMDSMAHDEDDLEWSDEEEGMREEESGEEEEEEEDGVSANYPTTARNGTPKQRSIEELEAMACAGRAAEFTEAESAALSQAIRANIRNIDFRKLGKRPTNNVVNMSQQLREARNRVQHAEDLSNMPLRSEASVSPGPQHTTTTTKKTARFFRSDKIERLISCKRERSMQVSSSTRNGQPKSIRSVHTQAIFEMSAHR